MDINLDNPLIVQSDGTLLLEVNNVNFEQARNKISLFADLIKSPGYLHTYKISPLSLWNAAARGVKSEQIIGVLKRFNKFPVPKTFINEVEEYINRYGLITFVQAGKDLICTSEDNNIINEIISSDSLREFFIKKIDGNKLMVNKAARGTLKQEMIKLGYPVKDMAGYQEGEYLKISLLQITKSGQPFSLRKYQQEAIADFYAKGSTDGGSGVVVSPCGSGKTIIGLGIMAEIKNETLILTANTTAVKQWINEILDKTTLSKEEVGEYTGDIKEVKPVTVATYQILTHRTDSAADFTHMKLFQQRNWGLIIYDEVHLLPAPIFRYTINIQAKRRLGLTATLIREDNKEKEVFSLIGPKKHDVPWLQIEEKGWIATAVCNESRVPLPRLHLEKYLATTAKQKYSIAANNPFKIPVVKKLLERHSNDQVLIIGQYLAQLKQIADEIKAPLITGTTKQQERERLYQAFKKGELRVIIVSKVANFAINLPDAKVAIQVSGTFGSRQEEAQRLGRILRPKKEDNLAYFYTIVTANTIDQDYAMKRQLFLIEQGYSYQIEEYTDISEDNHDITILS